MEVNDRFSIESYLGKEQAKAKPVDGVNSAQCSELVSKSQKTLQGRLNNKDLQEVFKNKSVSMMFLDKITRLLGEHHPDSKEANKFMLGPSFYPSMELIRHLSDIKSSLSPEAVLHLEEWIESEQGCLPIALIFDAWLLSNEDLVRQGTMKGAVTNNAAWPTITPPPEEVEVLAHALAAEMKGMQPGDKFKMPAGSVQHVTRLQFIKNSDETFDVIHFNTGLGVTNGDTAVKFVSIPAKTLEDPEFWKKLVEAKMQPEMGKLKSLLKESCKNMWDPFGRVDDRLKKPMQENDSCSFHAAEAEFKHSFISSFPTIEEGWKAYKQCTSLMASSAVKQETNLEPAIERMLTAKENVRRRYLDWMTIVDNPEKFNAAKNAYMEAIGSIGKYSQEENENLIANQPPLMVLKLLDKRLNECLSSVSYEQLNHIRETYGAAVTFDGFNHMGYKQLKWLEATREVLQDAGEFAGVKGTLLLKVRSLSSILLPDKWNSELQTKINYAVLDKGALVPLLSEYLLREDPEKGNQVLQALINEKAVDDPFFYDEKVLDAHILNAVKSDPQKVMGLLNKPVQEKDRELVLSRACGDLVGNGHISEAIEVAKRLEGVDQQSAYTRITFALMEKGNKELILSLIPLTGDQQSKMLVELVRRQCADNEVLDAIAIAQNLIDPEDKKTAFAAITLHYLEKGNIDEALLNVTLTTEEFQSQILRDIVGIHCENGKIPDAINLAFMIPIEGQRDFAFAKIAHALLAKGDIKGALVYVQLIETDRESSIILHDIVNLYCKNDKIKDATNVANMISDGNIRAAAFRMIREQK